MSGSPSSPRARSQRPGQRPLVAHVVYRFDVGGLENGVVNLINHLPADRYDHAVIALTDVTDFRHRITRERVEFRSMRKPPGHGLAIYRDLYRVFRQLRPSIVHTRNIAASEAQIPAFLAGVPVRIHGEHGWEKQDVTGGKASHHLQRRLLRPLIHRQVALSGEIRSYLEERVGVRPEGIAQICNGVDVARFRPRAERTSAAGHTGPVGRHFLDASAFVVGTVGRLSPVKHQRLLLAAFARAHASLVVESPETAARLRLVVAGDGPDRAMLELQAAATGLGDRVWMCGSRNDVPQLMADFDLFVLPSLAEGISNTVLEAMACGLPVIATRVGGNAELVDEGRTGMLVESDDVEAMAAAIVGYATDRERVGRDGEQARARATGAFSIEHMVGRYADLYDTLLAERQPMTRMASSTAPATSVAGQG